MSKTVEFYYDYVSPAAYLAWTQIYKIAERNGATVIRKPALLGGIFKTVGNSPPANIPAKGKWLFDDLGRFAKRYGVPFVFNDKFPVNTLYLMRGALFAQKQGFIEAYDKACFEAVWANNQDMSDPAIVTQVMKDAGLDPVAIGESMQAADIKKELFAVTAEAVENGLFGMPGFIVDGALYWGQDRMDFVEEALAD